MRILVFTWRDRTHPWAGGAEVNIHEQAKRWVTAGHAVTFFCASYAGAAPQDTQDGITILRRGGRFTVYLWAFWVYLVSLRGRFDVVVDVENGIPFFTPLYVRVPIVAVIYHIHTEQFRREFGGLLAEIGIWLESWLMPRLYRTQPIVTISESSQAELLALGYRRKQVTVVHTGIDASLYRYGGYKATHPVLVYVGRLMSYKRVHLLIEALAQIRARVPNVQLHIVGIGPMEAALKAQTAMLGLGDAIHFHGYLSDPAKVKLLQSAWLMVTPSLKEGWGLVVIEANACGTPVVAFDVAGLRDSIQPDVTGVLVQNEADFAAQIEALLADEMRRETLAQAALSHAARFSWDECARQTLALLTRVTQPESTPASWPDYAFAVEEIPIGIEETTP